MISLKLKYLIVQGFSALVSISAIALLYYFCSYGFTKLVDISAKNLGALYGVGELKSMLWIERVQLRSHLRNTGKATTFIKTAEKVTSLAEMIRENATANVRVVIDGFVEIHNEMHASIQAELSSTGVVDETAALVRAHLFYERAHAALNDVGEHLLLEAQEQQGSSIRGSTQSMEFALVGGVGFMILILLGSFFYLRRSVITPIVAISAASLDAAHGDYHSIPTTGSDDEIGLLAKNFNQMIDEIGRATEELNEFNRLLEEKVKERTDQLLETEGKLVTAAKMSALGEMAGGVAHEINTPLATIGLLTEQINELVQEEPLDRAMLSKMAATIALTVRRISLIIKGMRTFSRDGSQDPFVPASLRQIIEETLLLCGEKLKHADISVVVAPIAEDLMIRCRSVQLSQVLLNLVSNACDAIRPLPEKRLHIGFEVAPDRVRLLVTDSGPGIPENVRAKLFQPFFTTKEIGKGTGLGLSISRGIVAAHGGSLSLDLDCPNTRFVIDLPRIVGGDSADSNAA